MAIVATAATVTTVTTVTPIVAVAPIAPIAAVRMPRRRLLIRMVMPILPRPRIDTVTVHRRVAVVRAVGLARRQRQPAHGRAADAHRHAPMRTATHPGHQCRRINRPCDISARNPAPAVAPVHPTAIVEWRKSPRRFIDPGPAPGPHPGPAAVAVRYPVRPHRDGEPDRAVFDVLFPTAMAIEFLGAGHFWRHITVGRGALVVAAVFSQHPGSKTIVRRFDLRLAQIAAAAFANQLDALAAGHQPRSVGNPQFAAPAAGQRGVVGAVHAVVAGTLRQQPRFGGQQFDFVGNFARAHAQRNTASVELENDFVVVQSQHFKFAAVGQAQHGGAHPQLGAAVDGGADAVAAGQRPVALCLEPPAFFSVEPRHAAVEVGDAADTPRRVVLGQRRRW